VSEAKTIDYYFSFISLWSYIGSLAFAELVRRHGLRVNYKPIDLMAVFAASGGLPAQRPPQRQAYRLVEMRRWQAIRDIPLTFHPKFYPADPSRGHRMLLAAVRAGHDVGSFVHAGLRAVWADELDVADAATLVGWQTKAASMARRCRCKARATRSLPRNARSPTRLSRAACSARRSISIGANRSGDRIGSICWSVLSPVRPRANPFACRAAPALGGSSPD
jgi:2-hydroxychromene-2-carboxylate isomerase